jgi:hypothetical protein
MTSPQFHIGYCEDWAWLNSNLAPKKVDNIVWNLGSCDPDPSWHPFVGIKTRT